MCGGLRIPPAAAVKEGHVLRIMLLLVAAALPLAAYARECAAYAAKAQARPRPMRSAIRKWLGGIDATWIFVMQDADIE